MLHDVVDTTSKTNDQGDAHQARRTFGECINQSLFVQTALTEERKEHDDNRDCKEGCGHGREPPALAHNTPHHDRECCNEEDKDELLLPVKLEALIGALQGPLSVERFVVFPSVGCCRISLNLLCVPPQVANDDCSADDASGNTPSQAFSEDNASSIRRDDHREGIDGREGCSHRAR